MPPPDPYHTRDLPSVVRLSPSVARKPKRHDALNSFYRQMVFSGTC